MGSINDLEEAIVSDVVYGGLSYRQIAEKYDTSLRTVHIYLKKWRVATPKGRHGFRARTSLDVPASLRKMNRNVLMDLYDRLSQVDLSAKLGYSRPTIHAALMYHCVPLRNRKEAFEIGLRKTGVYPVYLRRRRAPKRAMEKSP